MTEWYIIPGEARGETSAIDLVAALATLITVGSPSQLALRVERAQEIRTQDRRCMFHLFPQCCVRGQIDSTIAVANAWRTGTMARTDPSHPLLACMAALHNARCLLDWMKRAITQRLVPAQVGHAARYQAGDVPLIMDKSAVRVRSLGKAAALAVCGHQLIGITGSDRAHEFIVARKANNILPHSAPPTDALDLLTQSAADTLPHDHPFELALVTHKNRENLMRHLDREESLLILTPDAMRKSAHYNPSGPHAYLHKDAPGELWDAAEKHFFG